VFAAAFLFGMKELVPIIEEEAKEKISDGRGRTKVLYIY